MSIEEFTEARTKILARFGRPSTLLDAAPDFLELLPIAVYACDADGRILWFNRRAADLWGREPLIGDDSEKYCGSYKLYFGGKFTPPEQCPMAAVLKTGVPICGAEGRIERPDGSSVWAMVHIEPVEDDAGTVVGAINCFHETTASHQSPDELEDFFENSAVGLHLVARDGTIVRANKAELQMLGYTAAEYIGKNIVDFHADRPVIDDILARLHRHEGIDQYPARLRAKDGSIRHVLITSNARVHNGEFVNTRCLTIDVTEQKIAQDALARRMEEQAALHAFTERLQRAETLEEVYDAALAAIMRALDCQRASILLFDDSDSMRFVASRWLSEEYRRAVDGHSPWTRSTNHPQPICYDDVEASDLPDELKRTVLKEGIQALTFIPLMEGGRLLGKFMAYYDRPHAFTDAEIGLGVTIARQLGFSIERVQTAQAAQQFVAIVESSDDAIISKDLDGIIRTWNPAAERIFGYTAKEAVGQPVTILIPPERLDEEPHILARIRSGERIDHYETVRRRKDGSWSTFRSRFRRCATRRARSSAPRRFRATSPTARRPRKSCGRASSACRTCSPPFRPRSTPPTPTARSPISTRRRSSSPAARPIARQRRMVRDLEALLAGRHAVAARPVSDGGGAQGRPCRSATPKPSPSARTAAACRSFPIRRRCAMPKARSSAPSTCWSTSASASRRKRINACCSTSSIIASRTTCRCCSRCSIRHRGKSARRKRRRS